MLLELQCCLVGKRSCVRALIQLGRMIHYCLNVTILFWFYQTEKVNQIYKMYRDKIISVHSSFPVVRLTGFVEHICY